MRSRPALLSALLVILGLSKAAGETTSYRLEVALEGEVVRWSAPIGIGEAFDLAFLHSQERCVWVQHYGVGYDGAIVQLASTFPCFGAGMPAAPADGTHVVRTAAGYTASAPATLGEVPMMNWRRGAITLGYRNRLVRVGNLFEDFERFTIRVR